MGGGGGGGGGDGGEKEEKAGEEEGVERHEELDQARGGGGGGGGGKREKGERGRERDVSACIRSEFGDRKDEHTEFDVDQKGKHQEYCAQTVAR